MPRPIAFNGNCSPWKPKPQHSWANSSRTRRSVAIMQPPLYFNQAMRAARQLDDSSAEDLAMLRTSFVALYGEKDPHAGLALANGQRRQPNTIATS